MKIPGRRESSKSNNLEWDEFCKKLKSVNFRKKNLQQ